MRNFWQWLIISTFFLLFFPTLNRQAILFAQDKPLTTPTNTTIANQPDLATEVRNLTKEIRKLQTSQNRLINILLLQVEQSLLEKQEEKLAETENQLRNLNVREANAEQRLNNIPNELVLRNILNRQEGERIVRAELQSELEQIRNERRRLEPIKARLIERLAGTNQRLDLLRTQLTIEENEEKEEEARPTAPSRQNKKNQ
jgi:hypothetical protein